MNFIAHYAVSQHQENPLFTFGCLLPDLYRGFTKDYHKFTKFIEPNNNLIFEGIKFHIATDKVFHNHPFFIAENKRLSKEIHQNNLAHKYSYIISHVLFELLLDQYLLTKNPTIHTHFYATLNHIDNAILTQKLLFFYDNDTTNKIIRIFKSFKTEEYAQFLADAKGIVSSLHHILGTKFDINFDTHKWKSFVEQNMEKYNSSFENFLNEIKLKLNNA